MAKRNRDDVEEGDTVVRKRVKKDGQKKLKGGEKRGINNGGIRESSTSSLLPVEKSAATGEKRDLWKKRVRLTVSLLPGTLGRTQKCIEDSIRMMLLKYSDGLGGILLAFENVKIEMDEHGQGARGWVLNELPYIHYTVSCDTLVFTPKVGSRLTGVVTETFPSHIGILVHSFFNAMISSDHLHVCGYKFDPELHNWVWNGEDGKTSAICNKDNVNFQVEKIHECEGAVSLEGAHPSLNLLVEDD